MFRRELEVVGFGSYADVGPTQLRLVSEEPSLPLHRVRAELYEGSRAWFVQSFYPRFMPGVTAKDYARLSAFALVRTVRAQLGAEAWKLDHVLCRLIRFDDWDDRYGGATHSVMAELGLADPRQLPKDVSETT